MLEHGSELSRHEELAFAVPSTDLPVGRPVRPTVVVFNAGAVARVRLDRKATSAGAGECPLWVDSVEKLRVARVRGR
jgi:hypothetical protein